MKRIAGVRFKKLGKIYFFDPEDIKIKKKDKVIVETAQGDEYGEVLIADRYIDETKLTSPLKKIIRIATEKDNKHYQTCKKKEEEAFKVCQKKIKEYNLEMTLTEVEFKFDNSKIMFYFTADGRIDFRELVKDLAAIYKTRIELRQIGVRDEVKRIGGNGVCGRELCCCSFLSDFDAVSIKMAKEQNLSLNSAKISGNCGRLMCCLRYEQDVYEEKLKKLPNIGAKVKTADGEGEVDRIETLKENVRVKFVDGEDIFYKKYNVKDIKVIKDVARRDEEIENLEEIKELEKLEKLDKLEKENNNMG